MWLLSTSYVLVKTHTRVFKISLNMLAIRIVLERLHGQYQPLGGLEASKLCSPITSVQHLSSGAFLVSYSSTSFMTLPLNSVTVLGDSATRVDGTYLGKSFLCKVFVSLSECLRVETRISWCIVQFIFSCPFTSACLYTLDLLYVFRSL